MAEVYCRQEDFILAQEEIEEALRLEPELPWAHWLRGVIALESEGLLDRARAELDSLSAILGGADASIESAHYDHLLGRIRLAEGEASEGLEALREAIEDCPREESRFYTRELVRGFLEAGRSEEAIREGLALLEYNPNDGEVLTLLGLAYEQTGDRQEMTGFLERALKVWEEADRDFLPLKRVQQKL